MPFLTTIVSTVPDLEHATGPVALLGVDPE